MNVHGMHRGSRADLLRVGAHTQASYMLLVAATFQFSEKVIYLEFGKTDYISFYL